MMTVNDREQGEDLFAERHSELSRALLEALEKVGRLARAAPADD
jgi:hypothetical protein